MFEFIIEDGTGIENATSYVTVEYVDDYADFLDDEEWGELSQEQKEKLIIQTTMFFDDMVTFASSILSEDQGLAFPRKEFKDANGRKIEGVPDLVKQSVTQLVLEAQHEPLTDQQVVLERQSWGNASEQYKFGYMEDENKVVFIKNRLMRLGYARSNTAFVTSVRA